MNWKLFILASVLIIGPLFLIVPDFMGGNPYDLFLFSDQQVTIQTHLYFFCEHVIIILLSYIIATEETRFKYPVRAFFWLQVADLVDYLLTYNSTWVNISGLPLSMNTLSIVIFGYVCLRYGRGDS